MRQRHTSWLLLATVLCLEYCIVAQVTTADYARAEQFLPWNSSKLILNAHLKPDWIGVSDSFYYVRQTDGSGKQFMLVNTKTGERQTAFDHGRLAEAFSRASGQTYSQDRLPFDHFMFGKDGKTIRFDLNGYSWKCNLIQYVCERSGPARDPAEAVSPNGRWAVFVKDHNLFVRPTGGGRPIQLTIDGKEDCDYGTLPGSDTFSVSMRLLSRNNPDVTPLLVPGVVWSPDSTRFVSYRLDQRRVKQMYLVQSDPPGGGARPILHSYRSPMPGDQDIATAQMMVFDVAQRRSVTLRCPPQPVTFITPIGFNFVSWDKKGRDVYLLQADRWWKTLKLTVANPRTGATRLVLQEQGSTYVEPTLALGEAPLMRIVGNGSEVIWFSERDGWGHLYLYDAKTGVLKNRITSGPWVVRKVLYVDEASRLVYITAMGMDKTEDPYLQHLYRVKLDGSQPELLTPENADHEISFSPDGRYFVDTYSRADQPSVSVLRTADGHVARQLERIDISGLTKMGWKLPEPFRVKAADGITDIYGLIYRPTNFSPAKKYPVLDSIYGGPQGLRTPKRFEAAAADLGQSQALAELGFIVITVDGRGTAYRSKAFHDFSYGRLGDAGGLEDHVAAIKELALKYSYFDLSRVGIYGHSGGGFAAARAMLAYPDFFKVAVSSSGNHDQRGYIAFWGEKYQGRLQGENYLEAANSELAGNLKGKLLLVWGDMDDNVSPGLSVQFIDALVKANKNFDTLILPNRNHSLWNDPYFTRRRWDYFVEHLLGLAPPQYKIETSPPDYETLDHAQAQTKRGKSN